MDEQKLHHFQVAFVDSHHQGPGGLTSQALSIHIRSDSTKRIVEQKIECHDIVGLGSLMKSCPSSFVGEQRICTAQEQVLEDVDG